MFTEGALWNDAAHAHDVGAYYAGGATMPNAQSNVPSGPYTIVVRDTVQEGGIPPSVEWSSTDGTGGSGSVPMSFGYCKQ